MNTILSLRKLLLAAAVTAATLVGSNAQAAGPSILPGPRYRTVVIYQTITRPIVIFVTRFDPFGYPRRVPIVTLRTFKIPVVKTIPVVY